MNDDDYEYEEDKPVEFPIDQTIDLFKVLEIPYGVPIDEVKTAFRKLSQELHPDKHADKTPEIQKKMSDKFTEVSHAYNILTDKELRDLYLGLRKGYLTMGQKKPQRNAPCSCGSGQKYKKCCLNKSSMD